MKNYKNLSSDLFWQVMLEKGWTGPQDINGLHEETIHVLHFILYEKWESNNPKEHLDFLESALILWTKPNTFDIIDGVAGNALMACTRINNDYPSKFYVDFSKKVLDYGVDINERDSDGESVAFWALSQKIYDSLFLEELFSLYDQFGLDWTIKSINSNESLEDEPYTKEIIDRIRLRKEQEYLNNILEPSQSKNKIKSISRL